MSEHATGTEPTSLSIDSILGTLEDVNFSADPQQPRSGRLNDGGDNNIGELNIDNMEIDYVKHASATGLYSAPAGSYGEADKHGGAADTNNGAQLRAAANDGAQLRAEEGSNYLPNINRLLIPGEDSSGSGDNTLADSGDSRSVPVPDWSSDGPLTAASSSLVRSTSGNEKPDVGAYYDPYNDFHRTLTLRDYQVEVAKRVLDNENDIILLPTGTGKTYVAIQLIINHLYRLREERAKVVFLVPTSILATQQLIKIQDHLPHAWHERTCKITGDDSMPPEQLKEVIKGSKFVVIVVTPAIINNYFRMCQQAALSDFSLLIFDEYHHAKKDHPYNELIKKYLEELAKEGDDAISTPQMVGMTATIGIGDATSLDNAKDYIIGMCAKFGLQHPPSESQKMFRISQSQPDEEYDTVERKREDKMSNHLQRNMMSILEVEVRRRLGSQLFKDHECGLTVDFPTDRYAQTYEQFIVNLLSTVTTFHSQEPLRDDTTYCMVALKHLWEYYKTLQLVNLLYCEHGMKYLDGLKDIPEYKAVTEIWTLFTDNLEELRRLQVEEDAHSKNTKVEKIQQRLSALFSRNPPSKVIIFVQLRAVAKYLANLLTTLDPAFKATAITSPGPTTEESGMKPQQITDAREGFEGDKYNIIVATSLLEEGIDIQACNMVIRYMYVKDMIAKIQSRGRARAKDAIMVALLDDKLHRQEQRNNYKEQMMYRALENIRAMPEQKFKELVAAEKRRQTPKKAGPPPKERHLTRGAKIACRQCGKQLGDMRDVRMFGVSHYLIIDGNLCDKVIPFPDPSVMRPMDGMVPYGQLLCKGDANRENACGMRVGTLMKLASGMHFGMWRINGITVNSNPLKKYKEVKTRYQIEIQPIFTEELYEVGADAQFPPELLQDRAVVPDD